MHTYFQYNLIPPRPCAYMCSEQATRWRSVYPGARKGDSDRSRRVTPTRSHQGGRGDFFFIQGWTGSERKWDRTLMMPGCRARGTSRLASVSTCIVVQCVQCTTSKTTLAMDSLPPRELKRVEAKNGISLQGPCAGPGMSGHMCCERAYELAVCPSRGGRGDSLTARDG